MNDSRYPEIGLYYHNADSYDKVRKAYESGEQVVGIVHATGTGKSFNALQLAYDNRDKKIVYVVPSNGIIEHLKEIINSNPNLDMERDFPNLEFRTYQSFISLERHEIEDIPCDLLILDEFHHIGAPVWGARVNTIIDTHPNIQVFGMTAYTVRDRGTPYERDMADPDAEELFSNKIASRYDLCDAMIDGVLPKPIYKSAYVSLLLTVQKLEEKVAKKDPNSKDYKELMPILSDVKKRIHEAQSIPTLLQKSLKPDGKYIYFCPPCSEEGANDIETIKKQAMEWFKQMYPDKEAVFYTSTSEMGVEGKENRDAFYNDVTLEGKDASNKLRIMFAINQYNEGIHAPNIDGVIMGRGTCSDIVFFEQIGRALSVRGNTTEKIEELEKHSIEELIKMCDEKGIPLKEGMTKDNIIEVLISPIIIDLTNNIDFIKELENQLKDRIREYNETGLGRSKRVLNIDGSIDVEMVNEDFYELLRYVTDRLVMTWEDYYELAKAYSKENDNLLLVPDDFKTVNGYEYDENGVNLYSWISRQRQAYRGEGGYKELSEERIKMLEEIGIVWDPVEYQWQKSYELAKAYFNEHKDLLISGLFITKNGYEKVKKGEKGIKLGEWISRQRQNYKNKVLSEERIKMLEKIGMVWDAKGSREAEVELKWQKYYELAKAYSKEHDNLLLVPDDFKTVNGYEYDESGEELGEWIYLQRRAYKGTGTVKISEEKIKMLEEIGMVWDAKSLREAEAELRWQRYYELAKAYSKEHDNLLVPSRFVTVNGIDESTEKEAVNLGVWIKNQRKAYRGEGGYKKLPEEKIKMLEEIGMVWDAKSLREAENELRWQRYYELAKAYSKGHDNLLLVPQDFVTVNGIDESTEKEAVNLGRWIQNQRQAYKGAGGYKKLPEEKIKMLEEIGMVWDPKKAKTK